MSISIATAAGSVTLKEMYEGYAKGIDPARGPWVRKRYLCPWGYSDQVINALVGRPIVTSPGGPVSYVFPHECPESPFLFCLSAECVPAAPYDVQDSGRPRFNLAPIEALYGVPPYDPTPDSDPSQAANSFTNDADPGTPFTYAIMSIDFDEEVIKLPGSAYEFNTADNNGNFLTVDVPVAKTIAVANMVFIRKLIPYLPFSQWNGLMGKLNQSTFLGQPRGQIKFSKWRTRRETASDGTRTQEIELILKWREYDHNQIHRPDFKKFDFISDKKNGNFMYDYADLTPLVR
jgi:hypothetical protein